MTKIFYSHTQKDSAFCDVFDRVCARVGIDAFRSELERIDLPAWKTILNEINQSAALFLMVGKELVKSQELGDPNWKFTQNWISYEIGIACLRGIDVWAICDDVLINFPMPYINNYCTASVSRPGAFNYFRDAILPWYNEGKCFPFPFGDVKSGKNLGVICGHNDCKAEFNLHMTLKPNEGIVCPQCLKYLVFPNGFPP
jgi:hypothetical protein